MKKPKARIKKGLHYLTGHFLIITALSVGLLINVSANIIYDMVKDNQTILNTILILTVVAFAVIIYTYHSKLREPVGKLLQEFE